MPEPRDTGLDETERLLRLARATPRSAFVRELEESVFERAGARTPEGPSAPLRWEPRWRSGWRC